jgi:ribosome biogenesis GTPase
MLNCHLPGKMLHLAESSADLPVVGDWCVTGDAFTDQSNKPAVLLERILPRRTTLARLSAGTRTEAQILAANADIAFLVTSANSEFKINRLRRYVLLAEHGYVRPVILISKCDLAEADIERLQYELKETFPEIVSIATSATEGVGLDELRALLKVGTSAVFLGSSGVGKSTLVNALLEQDVQKIGAIRANDDRGRHTTSGSGLFFVSSGGLIIDTAGLREVGLIADDDDLNKLMPSVHELSEECKFRDCSHSTEPGCAVQKALTTGALPEAEYDSYNKLQREMAYTRRKFDQQAAAAERDKWKKITMDQRRRYKER